MDELTLECMDSVSVVVPAYNERPNLATLHREIDRVMAATGVPWELILVDDASDDGSASVFLDLAAADPHVRVVTLAVRTGQSGALLAGFAAARGDVVVTLDADLQNDPADIPRLLAALPGHGAAVGWRRNRRDTWVRRMSSRIANGVRNAVTRETVTDTGCSLKAMRRHLLRHLPHSRGVHRFLPTLIRLEGATVVELPVGHRQRHAGTSKYGIGNRLLVGLGDLLMIRWLQKRRVHVKVARETGQGLPESARRPGEQIP
ncbi:MAG: glycosyltransferase family 2 protein [Acidobacteria bacterium]|nr:glycosyltransferase family 2 protein [Acidobacteriota bacterium]